MNPYMETLKSHLCNIEDAAPGLPIGEALYGCYRELHPLDNEEIGRRFRQLDKVLDRLPRREYDQVWNLTCCLCCDHEKSAFLEGIRVGISLATGMWET